MIRVSPVKLKHLLPMSGCLVLKRENAETRLECYRNLFIASLKTEVLALNSELEIQFGVLYCSLLGVITILVPGIS